MDTEQQTPIEELLQSGKDVCIGLFGKELADMNSPFLRTDILDPILKYCFSKVQQANDEKNAIKIVFATPMLLGEIGMMFLNKFYWLAKLVLENGPNIQTTNLRGGSTVSYITCADFLASTERYDIAIVLGVPLDNRPYYTKVREVIMAPKGFVPISFFEETLGLDEAEAEEDETVGQYYVNPFLLKRKNATV